MGLLSDLYKYERTISSRAWKDTQEYLRLTPKRAIFGITTGGAAIILGWSFEQTEAVITGLKGAGIGVFAWVLFYAWERTCAPFKLQNELSVENIALKKANAELKDPGFDVEFDYRGDSFYHCGSTRFHDGEYGHFELYRIAVKNHHIPQDISASVVKIEGADQLKDAAPFPLQFQHDHSASVRSMRLIAEQRVFIDVVQLSSTTTRPYGITIQSTVAGWRNTPIRGDGFKLKIDVCGEKAKASRYYEVKAGWDQNTGRMFHMHEITY